jgi:polar amino acid transport system permease protein
MSLSAPNTAADAKAEPGLAIDHRRRFHAGRAASAVVVLFVLVWLGYTVIVNPNIHWDVIAKYQFAHVVFSGLWVTIQLTIISTVIGILIGIAVAVMQLSENVVLRYSATLYIWFFRGTPLLVQLIFWFNLALLFPRISIAIPFGGPELTGWQTNHVVTSFVAAVLGLSINEGAYMSQIVRAGIQAVPPGQREAAESLGMSGRQVFSRVVLPQAMRVIIPPTSNQFISMLKTTSLVSVIAGADLLTVAQHLYLANFEVIALLIVASIWYLVLTTVASVGQYYVERHYSPERSGRRSVGARIRRNMRPGLCRMEEMA